MKREFFARPDTGWAGDVALQQVSATQIIVCPVCGFDYNHLQPPQPLLGWESSDNGERSAYHWVGRGDGLVLPIDGECGHRWAICLAFHKGQLFMFAIDDSDRGRDGLPDWVLQVLEADGDEGAER